MCSAICSIVGSLVVGHLVSSPAFSLTFRTAGASGVGTPDETTYWPSPPPGALAPFFIPSSQTTPLGLCGSSAAAVGMTAGGIQRPHRIFGGGVLGLFIGDCEPWRHQAKVPVPNIELYVSALAADNSASKKHRFPGHMQERERGTQRLYRTSRHQFDTNPA